MTALDSSLLLAPMSFLVDLHHPGGARALHEVRRLLETETAAPAARRADDAALAAAEEALDAVSTPQGVEPLEFVEADIRFHQVIARTVQEHRAILTAFQAHDSDRARLRVAHHLLAVEDFLTQHG